uniref:RNA-directed RNA polymerase n=1 Tax=Globodera rostochiensis TaxID=31243 RepID=A0A914GYY0_GLORO
MAAEWPEGCDFKVVFIHDKPEDIVVDAHDLLQSALNDERFVVEGNEFALAFVAQPRVFNPTDENGTEVEELEPRIEFYIGIIDKSKTIGCIFVLEHLMKCLRNCGEELQHLHYRIELRSPSDIDMVPFKRHLSASDTAQVGRVLFGNVLWHNQLYVHRRVKPNIQHMENILGKDVRQLHISSRVEQGGEDNRNIGRATGQSFDGRWPPTRSKAIPIPGKSASAGTKFSPENGGTVNDGHLCRKGSDQTLSNTPGTSGFFIKSPSPNSSDCTGSTLQPNLLPFLTEGDDSGVVLNGHDHDEDGIVPGWTTPPPPEEGDEGQTDDNPNIARKRMQKPKQLQLADGRIIELGMKAEFEHDRQMLSVTFFLPFQQHKYSWALIDKYKLEFRYSSISQVLLSLKRKGQSRFVPRLVLRIKYPPTIWCADDVFGLKERIAKTDKQFSRGNRVLGWPDPEEGMGSKEAVEDDVKDSSVFVLDLSSMEANELSALLSRFMVELKMKVELRNLHESQKERPKVALVGAIFDNPALLYWMQSLAARGYVAMDHWTVEAECDDFFNNLILGNFRENPEQTLEALEMLADKLFDRSEIKHHYGLGGMLEDIMMGVANNGDYVTPLRDGFERVRKVVITPSRIIPCGYEIMMGNRALRFDRDKYPPDKFLRIIFRDENGERVRKNDMNNGRLLDQFVLDRLVRGIEFGGQVYSFVGTSNSQMRDGGCYFLQADLEGVNDFRNRLGQFSLVPTIPKMMSRLGLCFTQGRATDVDMRLRMLACDFTGGLNLHKEPYTFSDGCGCLSVAAARQITAEIGLDVQNPPSCYQFRYAGYKGVLAVNPTLDRNKEFFDAQGGEDQQLSRKDFMAVDFLFRPSQKKFEVWQEYEEECRLDVVKISAPTSVVMNKPFINILDQVSQMQSDSCHKRICTRVHALLDKHIFSVCASLTDEAFARRRLQDLPRLIEYNALNSVQFTREPFFRLVLRSAAKVAIHRVSQKLAIAIPPELGRMMFGVIDETGILQNGQVFAQYTVDIDGAVTEHGWRNRKSKKRPSKKRILTGPVLVTKNPSIVGGDVRMLEAVDVAALHHLVDVLVFPRHGPRPHSDEMAGSDLDGDEYTLIWDEELALEGNQPATDYSAPKANSTPTADLSPDEYQYQMASFFVKYLKNDSVGQISNSHLANSDLYGIDCDVCTTIAKKHSQAVDFPKTGVPPAQLTNQWNEPVDLPPEKYERTPDFMGKMANEPCYVSTRLNAQLYRRIKALSDFLLNTISDESVRLPDMDKLLFSLEEHQEYIELAAEHYQKYAYSISNLMDSYGIQCEGELFSSSYSSLCNRVSDRENDDMSFFTTSRVIEQRLWDIRQAARKTFFGSFGGDMETLTDDEGICNNPSDQLKFLALAYYTIGYNSTSRKFLSFPWIASWDVLDAVRRSRILASLGQPGDSSGGCSRLFSGMFDSFGEHLTEHIELFNSSRRTELGEFSSRCFGDAPSSSAEEGQAESEAVKQLLYRYVLRHEGLAPLMFFTVEWAAHMGLFEQSPLKEEHICLLLLSAGLMNQPQNVLSSEERRPWLTETPVDWTESETAPRRAVTRPGRRFNSFVESLASRHFEQMRCLDFTHLGLESGLMFGGEWRELHRIALKTYYSLVFMDCNRHVLPSIDEQNSDCELRQDDDHDQATQPVIKQGDVFVIELPCRVESEYMLLSTKMRAQLCAQSGCHEIIIRRDPKSLPLARPILAKALHPSAVGRVQKPIRVIVSSWGSREALDQLHHFFAVRPQLDLKTNRRSRIQILPEETFEKLDKLTNEGTREREERLGEEMLNDYFRDEGAEEEAIDAAALLDCIEELQFVEDEGE